MMNYIKLVLIGGTLTLVLLGLGGLSVVVGIDATMHGRALTPGRSVSKVRIHRNYQSRQIPDRTYLWGRDWSPLGLRRSWQGSWSSRLP